MFEVRGARVDRRYLMRRTKSDLVGMYLRALEELDRADAKIAELLELLGDDY